MPLTAAIPAAALAIGGLWLIDGWIDGQGWAVLTGGKWAMAATGWPLLRQAWPLSLAGGIFKDGEAEHTKAAKTFHYFKNPEFTGLYDPAHTILAR